MVSGSSAKVCSGGQLLQVWHAGPSTESSAASYHYTIRVEVRCADQGAAQLLPALCRLSGCTAHPLKCWGLCFQ